MYQVSVKLLVEQNQDPVCLIGGLARLTQIKEPFTMTTRERGLKILEAIQTMGHTSLLEHVSFGMVITGASRVFLAQITRHRVASYMSQSQQYQDHDDFPYVTPASLVGDSAYTSFMHTANEVYKSLKAIVGKDDARYVLPGAARNDLFITMNARELAHAVFPQRLCKRNTPEPLHVVKLMLKALVDSGYGELFKGCGPACVSHGKCDQGKMACGKPYRAWEELYEV